MGAPLAGQPAVPEQPGRHRRPGRSDAHQPVSQSAVDERLLRHGDALLLDRAGPEAHDAGALAARQSRVPLLSGRPHGLSEPRRTPPHAPRPGEFLPRGAERRGLLAPAPAGLDAACGGRSAVGVRNVTIPCAPPAHRRRGPFLLLRRALPAALRRANLTLCSPPFAAVTWTFSPRSTSTTSTGGLAASTGCWRRCARAAPAMTTSSPRSRSTEATSASTI